MAQRRVTHCCIPLFLFVLFVFGSAYPHKPETDPKVVQNFLQDAENLNQHLSPRNSRQLKFADEVLELQNNQTKAPITVLSEITADSKLGTDPFFKEANREPKVLYNGAQLWKLKVDNPLVLIGLTKLNQQNEVGFWGGNESHIDMMVKPSGKQAAQEILANNHVPYEVVISDLQKAIDEENPVLDEDLEWASRKGHRMTWQSYHRIADIHGYLDFLAQTYPNLCSVQTIGNSLEGKPLKVLKISNGAVGNKGIWVDGGMHAREWISPASVTYIIDQVVEGYEQESSDIKNIDWYFHPVANPDGYEYTHMSDRLWRKNRRPGICSGVDLNRNFGYRWGGKGNSRNPCTETYGGSSAFSEPETIAIKNFFETSPANFKAYISFHSYGQYILYPWGYDNVVPPDYLDLQRVGQKAAQAMRMAGGGTYKVGAAANTLYPAAGGSDDWAKGTQKIKYSYTIELRDSGRYGFILPASLIQTTAKEALAAVRSIAAAEELEEAKLNIQNKSLQSNQQVDKSLQLELDKALENLKDLQEHNTALQVQYDSLNKSHQELKEQSDRLVSTNGDLERKLIESETVIMRLRNELQTLRDKYSNLLESEQNFKKSIEHEKELNRNLKLQADKDANMIQDLNRQVREMDRILKRKKPDSVSALILAANQSPDSEGRKLLEDRIKELEEEANERDTHSTKLFVDIQEKFNKMKEKYESHIEDLEKHVLDLKYQLISVEQADASTQTFLDTNRNVDYVNVGVQTITNKIPKRIISKPARDETQLLNTIRNLTQEISEKESIIIKLEKEMDELFKTNRRLQKERETALKSHVRNSKTYNPNEYRLEYDLPSDIENMNTLIGVAKDEKEALKLQLSRLEEDYQMLKVKRLQDLNTLQEAHEQELTNYMGKMSPLREQLEVQQITIKKLQQHLATAREQVAVLTVERDHLETILKGLRHFEQDCQNEEGNQAGSDYTVLQRRIAQLERRYEERELRLRAIVQGLAQKQTTNTARNCEQCMIRQQQLCGYKAELDQVLSTLRNCTNL